MLYTIEDTTLTAMGDAVRSYTGVLTETTTEAPEPFWTYDMEVNGADMSGWTESTSSYKYTVVIPQKEILGDCWDATSTLGYSFTYNNTKSSNLAGVSINMYANETHVGGYSSITFVDSNRYYSSLPYSYTGSKIISSDKNQEWWELVFYVPKQNFTTTNKITFHLELWAMSSSTEYVIPKKYTPLEMINEVYGIIEDFNNAPTIPEKAFTITGNCKYRFGYGGWDWFIKNGGDKITTTGITNAEYMFDYCQGITEIPFEINLNNKVSAQNMFEYCVKLIKAPKVNGTIGNIKNMFDYCNAITEIPDLTCDNSTYYDAGYIFRFCNQLKQLPYLYNLYPSATTSMFSGCTRLREMPEDYCDTWNWSRMQSYSYASAGEMFSGCYSLRKIPTSLLNNLWNVYTSQYGSAYRNTFYNCYVLDEIKGLGVSTATYTSNVFGNTLCCNERLKDFTFQTNEDGTPKTAKWKNQTIDIDSRTGYSQNVGGIINYNSGITEETRITDDATYQALKDNPDAWTTDFNYSRYNHTSAVNTINSLPDCSATGTNTIKFKGEAGAKTDGGAINTLTEEEIAVAISRGWTVTLV